jgi:hypothetical protein
MTSCAFECQSGQESRGFSAKRRFNLHNCGSNRGETGELCDSPLILQCETPLLRAILEYHKKYETALRASCFEFQLLVVCI